MVSLWGEKGAVLYHKLRKGFEEAIAAGTHEGRTHKASQEQRITVKRNEGGTFTVDKIERLLKRGHHNSEHRINWRQLALEAKSSQRTVTPPTHLFIRGHSRFEGKKLANLLFTGRQSRSKKGTR